MCKCVVDGVGTVGATVGAVQTAVVARGGDVLARTSGRPFGAGGWMLSRPPTEVAAALYSRRVSSEVPPTYTFAMEQEGALVPIVSLCPSETWAEALACAAESGTGERHGPCRCCKARGPTASLSASPIHPRAGSVATSVVAWRLWRS